MTSSNRSPILLGSFLKPFVESMSPPVRSDPDIILEGEVHEDAMSSGPFAPNPVPKPKKEETECIPLGADLYPSAPNGVSVSMQLAGVHRKAYRLIGGAAKRLKSFLGSGGGTIRVVSSCNTPVPGGEGCVDVHFEEGASVSGCRGGGGGSCEVREAEARAFFERALGALPSLPRGAFVGAAVGGEGQGEGEGDVRYVLKGIMADLASAGELDVDLGDDLDGAEEAKSDTVLITVCSCLDGDGAGFIEMRAVAVGDGKREQQDHDVGHMGPF